MALTSAMEDYLEAVLMMQKRHGYVRCVDVAEHLGVKKALCKPGCQGVVQIRASCKKCRRHTLPDRIWITVCRTDL